MPKRRKCSSLLLTGLEPEIDYSLYDTLTLSDSGSVYVFAIVNDQMGIWRLQVDLAADGSHESAVTPIAVIRDLSPSGQPWLEIGGAAGGDDNETYRVNSRDSVLFYARDSEIEGLFLRTSGGEGDLESC